MAADACLCAGRVADEDGGKGSKDDEADEEDEDEEEEQGAAPLSEKGAEGAKDDGTEPDSDATAVVPAALVVVVVVVAAVLAVVEAEARAAGGTAAGFVAVELPAPVLRGMDRWNVDGAPVPDCPVPLATTVEDEAETALDVETAALLVPGTCCAVGAVLALPEGRGG